jgi:hypothetical protein
VVLASLVGGGGLSLASLCASAPDSQTPNHSNQQPKQSWCRACVWYTYRDELKAFEEALAAEQGRGGGGGGGDSNAATRPTTTPPPPPPRPRSAAAASMDAFAELERQLAAGAARKKE